MMGLVRVLALAGRRLPVGRGGPRTGRSLVGRPRPVADQPSPVPARDGQLAQPGRGRGSGGLGGGRIGPATAAAGAATPPPGMVVMHELPPTTTDPAAGPVAGHPAGHHHPAAGPVRVATPPATRPEPRTSTTADAPPVMQVVELDADPTVDQPPHRDLRPPPDRPRPRVPTTTSSTTAPSRAHHRAATGSGPTPADRRRRAFDTRLAVLGSTPATWTIRPGDHLWRVASTTLAEPVASQTHRRAGPRLPPRPDRGQPGPPGRGRPIPTWCIPGQVFVLPPVPARPA